MSQLLLSSSQLFGVPQTNGASTPPFTIAVEGNIGCGKSTLLRHLASEPGVHVIEEPLDKWCDVRGHNLLALMYRQPSRWSFLFQTYVQLTRLQMHTDTTPCQVRIIERSLQNSRLCFTELAHSLGNLCGAEVNVLDSFYRYLDATMPLSVDLTIYLRTSPETVLHRMRTRQRGEEEGVPLDYLQRLHCWHERWLKPDLPRPDLLVIDADQSVESVLNQCSSHRHRIFGRTDSLPLHAFSS